jgi:hypothetical protein
LKVLNGLLIRTGRLKKQDVGMIALNHSEAISLHRKTQASVLRRANGDRL